jgi:hypothetical protein
LRYQLTSTTDGEEFTTEAGEQYVVYFSEAAAYFPNLAAAPHAFRLGLMRRGSSSPPADVPSHDARIRETIAYVVEQFFDDERRVLAYVCQQAPRSGRAIGYLRLGFGNTATADLSDAWWAQNKAYLPPLFTAPLTPMRKQRASTKRIGNLGAIRAFLGTV